LHDDAMMIICNRKDAYEKNKSPKIPLVVLHGSLEIYKIALP